MDAQIGRQRDEGVEDLHCQLHSMELTVAALPCLAFAYLFCEAHHQQATAAMA